MFSLSLFRYSLFLDHLHLRDGHLPLRVLRLLLERETGRGGGGEEFSQRGGRSLIARIRELDSISGISIKLKVGWINFPSWWYGLVFCHDPLNKSRPRKLFLLSFENLLKKYKLHTSTCSSSSIKKVALGDVNRKSVRTHQKWGEGHCRARDVWS